MKSFVRPQVYRRWKEQTYYIVTLPQEFTAKYPNFKQAKLEPKVENNSITFTVMVPDAAGEAGKAEDGAA